MERLTKFDFTPRNKLLLIGLLCCSLFTTAAERALAQSLQLPDSLVRVVANRPPAEQLEVLIPAWEQLSEYSVAGSDSLWRIITKLAEKADDDRSKALYARASAYSHYYRNQLDKAIELCIQSIKLLSEGSNPTGAQSEHNNIDYSVDRMQILLIRSRIYLALGELINTNRDLNEALLIATRLNRTPINSVFRNNFIAHVYLVKGQADMQRKDGNSAEDHFTKARLYFQKTNNRIGVAIADAHLSDIYIAQKDYPKAEIQLRRSLNLFISQRAYHYTAQCYLFLGNLALSRGNTDEAFDWYERCIRTDSVNQKLVALQGYYLKTAEVLAKAKNYPSAFRYVRNAKDIADSTSNKYALMLAYDIESMLHYNLGEYQQAYEAQQISSRYRSEVWDQQQLTEIAKNQVESIQLRVIDSLRGVNAIKQEESEENKRLATRLSWLSALLFIAILVSISLSIRIKKTYQQFKDKTYELELVNKELAAKNNELNYKNERLDSALLELERTQKQYVQSEKLAALGKLSGGIAHEILNPMNFIQIGHQQLEKSIKKLIQINNDYYQVISSIQPDHKCISQQNQQMTAIIQAEIQQFLLIIQSGIDKILRIIQSMRQLKPHDFKKGDIHKTINYALMMLQVQYPDIAVEKHFEENMPPVFADHIQLEQVFTNIINNAFQAIRMAKRTDGKIIIKTSYLEYKEDNSKIFAVIEIGDNGIGMTEEVKQQIYEPFFSKKDEGMGTGLGLYITKQILDLHRAKIDVVSQAGVGTNFIIAIPTN
ncbi:ATP-binding protein [Rhodoflexus sp.]